MATKILLLEDDILFNETLEDFLEEEGFLVDCAFNPNSALEFTYKNRYDLYLLDVNLPIENGFNFLKNLRDSNDNTPAIFLTSREDKESLKEGFLSGGDDYLKKPIDLDELLLRIKAILKRQVRNEIITIDGYEIDTISKTITKDNKVIDINKKAVELLILLLEANSKVVSLDEIKHRLWSISQDSSQGAIRVYITALKKLFPNYIQNVRGVGYIFQRS